jgi:hypothetical protein
MLGGALPGVNVQQLLPLSYHIPTEQEALHTESGLSLCITSCVFCNHGLWVNSMFMAATFRPSKLFAWLDRLGVSAAGYCLELPLIQLMTLTV